MMKNVMAIIAFSIALICITGCTKHEEGNHAGHQNKETGKKTAQVFENGRVIQFEEDAPVLDLVNQDGKKVTNADFKGKTILINVIYANCEESCPIQIHKFMEIEEAMKDKLGKSLQLVSITMDPERDSPAVLKSFAEKMDIDTSYWTLLTGDKSEIDKILKKFNFFYTKNDDGTFGHSNPIMTLNKEGKWIYTFNILTVPVDILLERIEKEV